MRRIAVLLLAFGAAAGASAVLVAALARQDGRGGDLDRALAAIRAQEIRADIAVLVSAEMAGRESGAAAGHQAALWLARRFEELGLAPGGQEGTYFQGFTEAGQPGALPRAPPREENFLRVPTRRRGEEETVWLNEGLWVLPGSPDGRVEGTLAQAVSAERDLPRGTLALWVAEGEPATWADRVRELAGAGAAGVVVCTSRERAPEFAAGGELPVPAVGLTHVASARVLATRGRSLENPRGFRVRGAILSTQGQGPVGVGLKNVIGVRRSEGAEAAEYVVIGAHYDHVGRGLWGSRGRAGQIHWGADDNASGTAALLAVARALGSVRLGRTVVLAAFDAEERGLWGSQAFVARPPEGLGRCVGMVNLDMVGRSDNGALSIGLTDESNAALAAAVAATEERFRVQFDRQAVLRDDLLRRSDHWSFGERGIAAMWFFTGLHADYHTERDTADKLSYNQIETIARMALFVAYRLAIREG